MNVAGYVRVSTREQGDSGLSLTAQKQKLGTEADRRGWQLAELAVEVASAKDVRRRPVLARLLEQLDAGEYQALMFTRLDRASRSVGDFAAMMARAEAKGWALVMLEPAVDMTTPFGRCMASVAAAFAQLERELIGQRTREGLAVARARGSFQPGAYRIYSDRAVIGRMLELADAGRSHGAIARALTLEGAPAPDGHAWHSRTVGRIINRERNRA